MSKSPVITPKSTLVLDIDDVLCMSSPYGGFDVRDAMNGIRDDLGPILSKIFSSGALNVLRRAHDKMEGNLSYVISSTWRHVFDREQMVRIFNGAGASFVADSLFPDEAWCTPFLPGEDKRADEISLWNRTYSRGEPFVILDDTYSGKSLLGAKSNPNHPWFWRVVMCDEYVGLLEEHFGEILVALKRPLALDNPYPSSTRRP